MNTVTTEVTCDTILARSQIDLGDYVINPYKGCGIGCRYCYVQRNKTIQKKKQPWGSFVEVKVNAAETLRRELVGKKGSIRRVLIGSTTEVYQPVEKQYCMMREILSVLNEYNIACTILTKSPLIVRDIDLLRRNQENHVYFTVHPASPEVQNVLETCAATVHERKEAIRTLSNAGVVVKTYFNPLVPHLFDIDTLIMSFSSISSILCFENINNTMVSWNTIYDCLACVIPEKIKKINDMIVSECEWNDYWRCVKEEIMLKSKSYNISAEIYFHWFNKYFDVIKYTV